MVQIKQMNRVVQKIDKIEQQNENKQQFRIESKQQNKIYQFQIPYPIYPLIIYLYQTYPSIQQFNHCMNNNIKINTQSPNLSTNLTRNSPQKHHTLQINKNQTKNITITPKNFHIKQFTSPKYNQSKIKKQTINHHIIPKNNHSPQKRLDISNHSPLLLPSSSPQNTQNIHKIFKQSYTNQPKSNKFNLIIDSPRNKSTSKNIIKSISIRSGSQSKLTDNNYGSKYNLQQLKAYLTTCQINKSKSKKIIQQKLNIQKILNSSVRRGSECIRRKSRGTQSPQYTKLEGDGDLIDQIKSFQQRKKSQNIFNLPKSKRQQMYDKYSQLTQINFNLKQNSLEQTKAQITKDGDNSRLIQQKKQQDKLNFSAQVSRQKIIIPKTPISYNLENLQQNQKFYKINYTSCDHTGKTGFHKKKELSTVNLNSFQIFKKQQTKLQHFYLGKIIGTGKFGEVYQAKHKKTGFVVAIKKIYKAKIKQYNLKNQLLQEIRLQNYTHHPNIVNMYGIFSDSHHIYLILQYMEGGTLFNYLYKHQRLFPQEVSLIMKQISLAVKYLHQNQIAHRDIKPENILFSFGVAKLCDFGWSARVIDKRKTYCGTFDYVPPQMLQRKQYDESVDLWCLGILMYELLTGKVPFEHKQKTVLMNRIINVDKQKIEYPQYMLKQAIQVIQHLIRKNPQERTRTELLLEFAFFKMKF